MRIKKHILFPLVVVLFTPLGAQARSGAEVFSAACVACHGSGAPGIPQKGDVAAWGPRIAQGREALYASVINGKNAMPPRGVCMDCSDEELKAAVDHLVATSGGK